MGHFALGTPPGIPTFVQSTVRDAGSKGVPADRSEPKKTIANPVSIGNILRKQEKFVLVMPLRVAWRTPSPNSIRVQDSKPILLTRIPKLEPQIPGISQILRRLLGDDRTNLVVAKLQGVAARFLS
jgi:hypothetical protein